MPATERHLLVVRPYLAQSGRDYAFGHAEALVMRGPAGALPTRYGALQPIGWLEDQGTPKRERFRFTAQIDEVSRATYAHRFGYTPENCGEVWTLRDRAWADRSLRALERGLARLKAREGHTEALAVTLHRLARVMRLDGIAVLAIRSWGASFHADHPVHVAALLPDVAPALAAIEAAERALHDACAQRAGLLAA